MGACVVAASFFIAGVFVGRNWTGSSTYHGILTTETPLVGHWQISSNVEPKLSTIEFRPDRTAIKYNVQGEACIVADWGFFSDQLSLQNGHVPGETGHYMPPSLFNVLAIDQHKIHLATADGSVTWELTRL